MTVASPDVAHAYEWGSWRITLHPPDVDGITLSLSVFTERYEGHSCRRLHSRASGRSAYTSSIHGRLGGQSTNTNSNAEAGDCEARLTFSVLWRKSGRWGTQVSVRWFDATTYSASNHAGMTVPQSCFFSIYRDMSTNGLHRFRNS